MSTSWNNNKSKNVPEKRSWVITEVRLAVCRLAKLLHSREPQLPRHGLKVFFTEPTFHHHQPPPLGALWPAQPASPQANTPVFTPFFYPF